MADDPEMGSPPDDAVDTERVEESREHEPRRATAPGEPAWPSPEPPDRDAAPASDDRPSGDDGDTESEAEAEADTDNDTDNDTATATNDESRTGDAEPLTGERADTTGADPEAGEVGATAGDEAEEAEADEDDEADEADEADTTTPAATDDERPRDTAASKTVAAGADDEVWHEGRRTSALRRSSVAVIVIVLWTVTVGVGWRQLRGPETAIPATDLSATSDEQPRSIEVDAGDTLTEIGELIEEMGLDTAERFVELANSPQDLVLPAEITDVETLDGLIAPGSYPVTPTSDARTLLERMAAAWIDQLSPAIRHAFETRGLDLVSGAELAGSAQAVTSSRSELPVATAIGLAGGLPVADELGATSEAALFAAGFPVQTTARNFHIDAAGDLRLGPPEHEGPPPPSGLTQDLVNLQLESLDARVGVVVRQVGGPTIAAIHPHRFIETASVYKAAVMAVVMDEVEEGRLVLDRAVAAQMIGIHPRTGADLIAPLEDETLREALRLAIVESNNTAAEALLFGVGADTINDRLRSWGVEEFFVGSRPQVTTADSVAQLLAVIASGEAHEPTTRAYMLDLMSQGSQDRRLAMWVNDPVPHKTGTVEGVVNDAGLIAVGSEWYAVVVLTERVDEPREAELAMGAIGQIVDLLRNGYDDAAIDLARGDIEGCELSPTVVDAQLAGRRIAIDAAHGGAEAGMSFPDGRGGDVDESALTLEHADRLADRLRDAGAAVLLTRCDDADLTAAQRAAILNAWAPDLVVSFDYEGQPGSTRNEVTLYQARGDGAALAEAMQNHRVRLSEAAQAIDVAPEVRRSRSPLLRLIRAPGVIIGPGNLELESERAGLLAGLEGDGPHFTVLADLFSAMVSGAASAD